MSHWLILGALFFSNAASAVAQKFDCNSLLIADVRPDQHTEIGVNFGPRIKTVSVLGAPARNGRPVMADLEFTVRGDRMAVVSITSERITGAGHDFTNLLFKRSFSEYPNIAEISTVLFAEDVADIPEKLSHGLTLKQAVAETKVAAAFRRLGFPTLEYAQMSFEEDDPTNHIIIRVVFSRLGDRS